MNKVFLFALQLGVLAPFWRSMQALLWANSGRASEGALWNIVYCGGPLLIACALARWRILKGKETFSVSPFTKQVLQEVYDGRRPNMEYSPRPGCRLLFLEITFQGDRAVLARGMLAE